MIWWGVQGDLGQLEAEGQRYLIKTWARAVAGTMRKDGRETLCEDEIEELASLDVKREGVG